MTRIKDEPTFQTHFQENELVLYLGHYSLNICLARTERIFVITFKLNV